MPYATNLPRLPRPRGLGALGHTFGTWVVDRMWGLSPAIVPGQGRPYGPDIVQTIYPRAQNPRYLNVDYGVVGRAQWKWPQYPAASGPGAAVFRLPLNAPGVREDDGPEAYETAPAFKGYGSIPVGRAQPAWDQVTRRDEAGGLQGVAEAWQNVAALGSAKVWAPALGGAATMFVAGALPQGGAQAAARIAGLGAFAWGIYNLWQAATAAQTSGQPEAAETPQTGRIIESIPTAGIQSADRGTILTAWACYVNASKRTGWWNRVIGKELDPLRNCGLTQAQADRLAIQVTAIPPAERHAMYPALYDERGGLR